MHSVLSSNRGGLPYAVGKGGIILDAHAPVSEWVANLERLCSDERLYAEMCSRARQNASRHEFSVESILQQFLQQIRQHVLDPLAGERGNDRII